MLDVSSHDMHACTMYHYCLQYTVVLSGLVLLEIGVVLYVYLRQDSVCAYTCILTVRQTAVD